MPKIAVIGVPLHGHVRPVVPLLQALHKRGFEVHYYNTPRFAPVAKEACSVFVEYDSLLEKDPYAHPCLIFLHREIPHAIAQLEERILREQYDLLLYDSFCLWVKYLVLLHKLPAVGLFTTYPNARIRDTGLSRLVHLEYEDATLDYLQRYNLSAYTIDCPAMKPMPRTIGLHDLKLLDSILRSPGLNCPPQISAARVIEEPAPMNLAFLPGEFLSDPPNKPGARYHFLSSLYRLQPLQGASPEKTVYASFGTRSVIIERLITAWVKGPPVANLKLHVAAGSEAGRLQGHAGRDLIIESFVDQHAVLARAGAFITHCGMNGVMEAILTETPMLVIPLTLEQEITARNIERFQLGMRCPLEKLEKIDLKQLLVQLMDSRTIRENLKSWRTRIINAGGAERAVELIKDHLESGAALRPAANNFNAALQYSPNAIVRILPDRRLLGIRQRTPAAGDDKTLDFELSPADAAILELLAFNPKPEETYSLFKLLDYGRNSLDSLYESVCSAHPRLRQAQYVQVYLGKKTVQCTGLALNDSRNTNSLLKLDLTAHAVQDPRVAACILAHKGEGLTVASDSFPDYNSFVERLQSLRDAGFVLPDVGALDWGDLRRPYPVCQFFGFLRGTPIDRYYLDRFVESIRQDVVGAVLEVGGEKKNRDLYGFKNAAAYRILDLPGLSDDIAGDVNDPRILPESSFDSILIFNVLEHCERPQLVVDNIHRWLKPGGQAFALVPSTQKLHPSPGDYWRPMPQGLQSLFNVFQKREMRVYGNLTAMIAALQGIAAEELTPEELEFNHPDYPVVSCIIARK